MNTTKIDKLQKLIHTVFADGERPKSPGEIVPLEYYDDDYIREYFTGKTWQELANIEDLQGCSSALSFFTPKAFVYFLPAFMLVTLDDPERADAIPDGIDHRIEVDGKVITDLLSEEQKDIVAQFRCFDFEQEGQ